MRKYYTILFLFISLLAFSQNNGINFQGVGRNSTGAVLTSQKISLRFSVIQGSETGSVEYVETKEVTTNAQGIFSVVIGDGTQISKTGNFTDINWKISSKFLKVEMDPAGGSSFAAMGTTRLQSVPFAYYANGVNADNVDGVLSASKGGTGVASISALKTALGVDQINNTSDLAKPISTATQTALDTKVSTATFSTMVATKANATDLALKAPLESPTFTGTVSGITKVMVGLTNVENTADLAKPINTATQTALDTKVSTATYSMTMSTKANVADVALKANVSDVALKAPLESPTFTGTVSGITKAMVGLSNVENTADIAKSISTATQSALDTKVSTATFSSTVATKENATNKSTASDLGAGATSDIFFPTQKAVKTYVDGQINSGGVADGGILTRHLADGAVTDTKIASGISKSKVGLSNVENTALSTWAGSINLSAVGTITSGIWSGTAIDYSKLDLNNKIVNRDIVDNSITMQKLGISKSDFTNFGLAGDEEVIIYQAGNGLTSSTIVNPGAKRSGSDGIITTFNVNGINSTMILDGAVINSKISDGTITGAKIIDGEITDSKLSNGLNKSKMGLGNVENTALSTWVGSSFLSTVGNISSGVWSASTINIEKGGTGATNAVDARANLGLVIGTNVQAPLVAGIDYLAPNGSVTSFPILNQNTTGNAATATLATTATTANTATKLVTARTINGVEFDGSTNITVKANAGTLTGSTLNSTVTSSSLTSIGTLANLTVTNPIIGNITGSSASTTGNAATATLATTATNAATASNSTKLATARNINGVAFDGSTDIIVTANAGTLSGTTLNATVTSSSLTSVGTIANLNTGSITNSGKIVVGVSSPTSASAVLEVSSTTQGFLPPRMTFNQRNSIISPALGLIIYCKNCGTTGQPQFYDGSAWVNMIGGPAEGELTIGYSYKGGKIAYFLQPGDQGYDPDVLHGLIAAVVDQSNWIGWQENLDPSSQRYLTGAIGTATGTGLSNTNSIISIQGGTRTNYAAGLARAYNEGGYTDWYLPSKDELNKLYQNRVAIGGFSNVAYWSSSERDINIAWSQDFSGGGSTGNEKHLTMNIRAIRAF